MEFFMTFLQRNGILTLVILAVLLVRLILRRLPKKYSYLLWSVVGIRMLFQIQLPARFSLLSIWHFLMQRISGIRFLTDSPKVTISNMQRLTDLQAGTQNLQPAGQLITGQTVTGAAQGLSQAGSGLGSGWNQILQICMFIWIAGVIALMLYGIISYLKCRRMTAQAVHMEANIWECDHLTTPFVLGIIKPRIYIPFHLSVEEKPYILAHEMYHIRRGDPIVRLLAFVLLAAYWINPFVWIAYFLMIRDMEMSCDEAVLLQLGTQIRKAYSNSLLTFATGRKQVTFSPLAFGESDTSGRIKNILDFKKPKVWGSLLAILAVILAAVFCLTGQKTEDDTSALQTADAAQSEQQVTENVQNKKAAEAAQQETEAARQTAEQAQQESETTADAADAANAAEQAQQDAEKAAEAAAESARQKMEEQVQDMMDSILAELDGDLSKAYPWGNTPKFKDDARALIKMAEDPTGQYAAYGFLCGEYGSYGILLNNKLNGEDNWNYFYTPWAYTGTSDSEPTMEKAADGYSGTFTFPAPASDPADSSIQVKTWNLQSYDTGTIEIEDVTKSAENALLYGNTIAGLDDQTQFALVDIGLEHPVLFTTEQSYTYDTGVQAALDCHVYYVIDGSVKDLGSVESEGTAYPVSYGQGCIYTAGNHSVSKYAIDETTCQLICEQKDDTRSEADFNKAMEAYHESVPISFSYGAAE
ncbi:M56 family metallopeptidase [Kineothrix sp. MSJ-39]|uniref:M56 family metallopeptidase n=1 Tax=Kineothrix sp. MSJ-39 TaxID=2841533 RepID=UPI001C0FFB73|nr:M56 family metallopeptidase [Kineothrix sp. MSJ-39]MBU5429436.1 M56 family metallopeptidase [Kineothrix sp. MSJ-39]